MSPDKKATLEVHLTLESKGENPLRDAVPSSPNFASLLATAHALADRAGAVILPHFRSGLAIDHKGGALFDPVTAADSRRRNRHQRGDRRHPPGARHRRRGARREPSRGRLLLDHRSDRRHPRLHRRPAAMGHPYRPPQERYTAAWPDEPALHRRALLERGDAKLLPPRERRGADHPHPCLRKLWRGAASLLEPRPVRDRGGTGELRTHLQAPFGCDASAATATIIACSRSARSTSWSRPGSRISTSCR